MSLPRCRDGPILTSAQLALQLLHRCVHPIGTTMLSRQGHSAAVTEKKRLRSADIAHGKTRFEVSKSCLSMTAAEWWNNRPVQVLTTGGSRDM